MLSPSRKTFDYPETTNFINLTKGKIPILGICLGFQLLLASDGARIIRQTQVLHGVGTEISTTTVSKTYHDLPPSIWVARYHSLQVDPESLPNLPSSVKITSYDPVHKIPLSFEDLERSLFGLQYHPESFLTTAGKTLIANIRTAYGVTRECLEHPYLGASSVFTTLRILPGQVHFLQRNISTD